jgi:regulator of sirC expression with transglutaminase-like and TPR domain
MRGYLVIRMATFNNNDLSFLDELNQPTINLPRAALRIARSIAYPVLDVNSYLERIQLLANQARCEVPTDQSLAERVDALASFLFRRMGFSGDPHEEDDPDRGYLNCVLDQKAGSPITLSVLFIAVAKRIGLNAYGIGLPGHFIAGVYEGGVDLMVDPFNGGQRLTLADCCRLVRESTNFQGPFHPKWLAPVTSEDILARMLTNLCQVYIQREEWDLAIPVIQHLQLVQPETDHHLRDLGYVYLYNGSLRQSARYLEEYLHRMPEAQDYDNVRNSLRIVAARLALWN